jgi:RNA polymerase sigma-70 factor (ECF subfamily)
MRELTESQIAKLLDLIQAGDEPSMCTLYLAFGRRVYAFALNTLRDHGDAEQVVVDTMYEVWRQAHRFNRQCRFSTWLLGIARNKILHVLRDRAPDHEDIDSVQDLLPCPNSDPYRSVAERQHRQTVLSCLEELPGPQRECLQLVLAEGLSLAEIAEIQGCPENTVKTRLFKARRRVKESLIRLLGDDLGLPGTATRPAPAPVEAFAAA